MRLFLVLLTMLFPAAAVAAQGPVSTSPGARPASAADSAAPATLALQRIRARLQLPDELQIKNVDAQPDFTVKIDEQRMIDQMLSQMDFKTGPAPAGGIYNWEQQRMLAKVTNNPLLQPFAAFSAGEFFTIAAENLARVYLGNKVKKSLSNARQANADADARREVDDEIAAYCADQANPAVIELCAALPQSAR